MFIVITPVHGIFWGDAMNKELALVSHPTREQVFQYEALLAELPQVELKVDDHFSHGVYARELFIPAGVTLTGKIHKYENMNILIQGEMSVLTDDGMKRVCAPFIVVSPPGTKRVAYAHTDCRWVTIHGTHEKDVDAIEAEFIAQSEAEFLEFSKFQGVKLWHGQQ